MKLALQPGPSSFPEGTSSPDGLHAANYKGNPGSVKAGAKTSLIAAMPGSHQMSGLFIHLGVSRPGCLRAGLDLPRESRLLFHPRRSRAASDAAPAPSPISGWRILGFFSVLQPGRKRSVSSGCGCPCLSAPVTQTWHWALQRPSASSSGGSTAPRRQTDPRWKDGVSLKEPSC